MTNTTDPWQKADNLIHQISTHKEADNFYITMLPSEILNVGTFAPDNWQYLPEFWGNFITIATKAEDISCVLVIRQFTKMHVIGQAPSLTKVAASILMPFEIHPLTGEEFKEASSFDNKTGEAIKPEPNVHYMDFIKLARQLGLEI